MCRSRSCSSSREWTPQGTPTRRYPELRICWWLWKTTIYIYMHIHIYTCIYIYICKWMFSWGEISAFEIRRRFIQCGIFPLPSKFGWLNIDWIICLDTDTIRYSWPLHKIINQAIGWFPSELGPWHGDEATTIALNDSGPWHARKGAGRRAKIGPAGGERWPATDRVGSMVGEIIFLH